MPVPWDEKVENPVNQRTSCCYRTFCHRSSLCKSVLPLKSIVFGMRQCYGAHHIDAALVPATGPAPDRGRKKDAAPCSSEPRLWLLNTGVIVFICILYSTKHTYVLTVLITRVGRRITKIIKTRVCKNRNPLLLFFLYRNGRYCNQSG
jgi:hypothetical protein